MKKFFCGPESFTPDLRPIVGEAPELRNYFVAAGLNSIGILTRRRPGARDGALDHQRPARRRRDRHQHRPPACLPGEPASTAARARSSRSAWSTSATTRRTRSRPRAVRSSRRSTTDSRLQGAYFSDVERLGEPRLVRGARQRRRIRDPLPGARQRWFPHWAGRAPRRARERRSLMDMSFMAKFLVQGRDAGRCLNRISANDVDGAGGHDHVHAVAQRRPARSKPTSPSPSWPTTGSSWSSPTRWCAMPRPG